MAEQINEKEKVAPSFPSDPEKLLKKVLSLESGLSIANKEIKQLQDKLTDLKKEKDNEIAQLKKQVEQLGNRLSHQIANVMPMGPLGVREKNLDY